MDKYKRHKEGGHHDTEHVPTDFGTPISLHVNEDSKQGFPPETLNVGNTAQFQSSVSDVVVEVDQPNAKKKKKKGHSKNGEPPVPLSGTFVDPATEEEAPRTELE